MASRPTQTELAELAGVSQSTLSRWQRRAEDPLPKDRKGAMAWLQRHGYAPAVAPLSPAPLQASATESGEDLFEDLPTLSEADRRLKVTREQKLRAELDAMTGGMMPREEVEKREILLASWFRRIAVDYPIRAQAIITRHLADAALVAKILADLKPLAADFLNAEPIRKVCRGVSAEIVRAVISQDIEQALADWPPAPAGIDGLANLEAFVSRALGDGTVFLQVLDAARNIGAAAVLSGDRDLARRAFVLAVRVAYHAAPEQLDALRAQLDALRASAEPVPAAAVTSAP